MTQALVVVFVFLIFTLVAAAVALLMRDLAGGRSATLALSEGHTVALRPQEPAGEAPRGLIRGLDDQILGWIQDSGLEMSPTTGSLVLAFSVLFFGGLAYVASEDLLTTVVGVVIGVAVPMLLLMMRRIRNLRYIQRLLPDVFDLLARAVRAGQSIEQAIETAGQRAAEPLGREFRTCSRQLQMGLSVADVTRQLAGRVRLLEMRIFALVMGVHRQTGGNLTLTLERMAGVVRERLASQQQLRAATGAGRFSATMISCVGPLLFLYMFLFQFDYARRLMTEPAGQVMLLVAVVLEIVGIIWVIRMLRRD